ncbi:hypothetical protein QTP70_027729, partial [Hemibagrus guttatus]
RKLGSERRGSYDTALLEQRGLRALLNCPTVELGGATTSATTAPLVVEPSLLEPLVLKLLVFDDVMLVFDGCFMILLSFFDNSLIILLSLFDDCLMIVLSFFDDCLMMLSVVHSEYIWGYLHSFIHSLSTAYPIYSLVTGSPCLSQASLVIKAGYTLDRVPTHRRAHTHSHSLTQSHTTDNLEMSINLQCMSLDRGRKPEYTEETPEARGEHANSTHTAEAGIEPPTLEISQASSVLIFLELSAAFDTVNHKTCPSSGVLEFVEQHGNGLLPTWMVVHI